MAYCVWQFKIEMSLTSVDIWTTAGGGAIWGSFRRWSLARRSTLLGVSFESKKPHTTSSLFSLFLSVVGDVSSLTLLLLLPCLPLTTMPPLPWCTLIPLGQWAKINLPLQVTFVIVFYHSNRKVTNTLYDTIYVEFVFLKNSNL